MMAHEALMRQAVFEAQAAFDEGEVPVGAVVAKEGVVIARGHNRMEKSGDPTAHAEVIAIGAAAAYVGDWRLEGCCLYSTLEPCPMCAGAVLNARVAQVVFGASDPRMGACGGACDLMDGALLNRRVEVVPGILREDCARLLEGFFRTVRRRERRE